MPFALLFFIAIVLTGCSDPEFDRAGEALKKAGGNLGTLRRVLEKPPSGAPSALANIKYLQQYAAYVRKAQPEMEELVSTLEKEATVEGGRFYYLDLRYKSAKKKYPGAAEKSRKTAIFVGAEATAVAIGSQLDVFNDGLVDVINVLADMSKGKLPKLAFGKTSDTKMPPTQHLVGNPSYGAWQRDSRGEYLWAWYGKYRLFSDVIGWGSGYRYNQDYWYRSRSASYYGDVGRHYYGTSRSNNSWGVAARNNPKVAKNRIAPAQAKRFKSSSRLSSYSPRTNSAPGAKARSTSRSSTYSNTRSSPSRSGGYSRRSSGK